MAEPSPFFGLPTELVSLITTHDGATATAAGPVCRRWRQLTEAARLRPGWELVPGSGPLLPGGEKRAARFLHARCRAGDLAGAQWLATRFELGPATAQCFAQGALFSACDEGSLPLVRWLIAHFALYLSANCTCRDRALSIACRRGHPTLAQWLARRYPSQLVAADHLIAAATSGHLAITQWLVSKFALSPSSAGLEGARCIAAFINACSHGHLRVAQWLADRFALTEHNLARNKVFLRGAVCEQGQLHVMRWLVERFNLITSAKDVESALRVACIWGRLELATWLASEFKITGDLSQARNRKTFSCACSGASLQVVSWLTEHFSVSGADIRANGAELLRKIAGPPPFGYASTRGGVLVVREHATKRAALLRWAVKQFGLNADELQVEGAALNPTEVASAPESL
jgi:Ankyrin repeats (many copies)